MQEKEVRQVWLSVLALALILALAPLSSPVSAQTGSAGLFVNEIHYDNSGTDVDEAIEVAGPAGTDLAGWRLVLYNGNGGAVYDTTDLSGTIPDQQSGYGTLVFTYPTNGIQNGSPDGVALVDPTDAVVQFLSYEGTFTAVGGPADGLTSTDVGLQEGSSTPAGDSLQLTGTGLAYEDFAWTGPTASTYGAVNAGQTFDNGSVDYTPIYDIQYTTDPSGASPLADQADVTTEGIVTGRFQYGYFIEDPAGGAWNGLWVHDTANAPARGDRVRVTGTVVEYYDLTELDALTDFQLLSSSNPLPGPAVLATGDVSQEAWESVLVRVEDVTVTNEDLGYGEWSVSDGSGDVVIDDKGSYAYSPVNGDALAAITGPLDYSYGAFKMLPRDDADIALPTPASPLVINEVLADPASGLAGDANGDGVRDATADEFVEIVNDSDGDVDISGWTVSDGIGVRHTFPTGTVVPAQCGIVVFGSGTPTGAFGGMVVQTASTGALGLNNGGDTITLSDGSTDQTAMAYGSEGSDNQSLVRDPDVTGAFVQHSTATGSGGALFSPGVQIDGSSFAGCGPIFGACGDPATLVHEVQGGGFTSPLDGASGIVIEGVVVGDFQDPATELGGFFLQEEDSDTDADPATSEGIFVYDAGFGLDVAVGDVVRVQGSVTEFFDLTELNEVSELAICATGASATAATINLPVADLAAWEPHEGMLIHIPQTLYATDNYNLGRYGEISLSVDDRLFAPTNVVTPGVEALALQDLNARSRILLDDGSQLENPLPLPPYLGAENTLRAGDTTSGLTGVLSYGFDSYRVQPTEPVTFTRLNERTAAPQPVGGRLKVASFNVLNYFNGDGMGGGFPTSRGADTQEEFERQEDKIVSAILALDADVVGLIEIENDGYGPNSAIADLVDALNEATGAGTYAYVDPGVPQIGEDEIAVGFIYQPATVAPAGASAILDSSVDPRFIDTKNRPALAQTFEENGTGERFTAVVNHLKSKGSSCEDIGDPAAGDGQGNCNGTRTSAALALADWLAADPTGSGDPDVLIIGDLNAYAMEDPIVALEDAGYTDLIEAYGRSDPYSYVFFGQAGYLDHGLANPELLPQVTDATVWHVNADEPNALNYNDYNQPVLYAPDAYRSSDHDPVLIGLDLASAKPLEDVALHAATIYWYRSNDGRARLSTRGTFDLPDGWTPGDLTRDLTLCITIAEETGCDTITFTQHGRTWRHRWPDGTGEGLDIGHAFIVWTPRGAIVSLRGILTLPDVGPETSPAEATFELTLPTKVVSPTPEFLAEGSVAFETHKHLWFYRNR